MSFRLIATDGRVTVAIEDDNMKAAVARMFQDLAASATSAAEAPLKRGPGRPPKSNAAQVAATNAAEEPPPAAQ